MSAVGQANVPVQRRRSSAVRCNRLLGVIVPLAPEYNMGGFLRRNELNAFVSQSAHVNPLEQSLSPAQQDRRDSDVQLIEEARMKILLDSVRSAANAHIHSVGIHRRTSGFDPKPPVADCRYLPFRNAEAVIANRR
jgi:hypothetical protein